MAILNITVPQTKLLFYPDTQVAQIRTKVAQIKAQYGQYTSNISKLTNVPENIILAFIFIESAGNAGVISGAGAIGLMQLMLNSATDILILENTRYRLSDGEKALLRKYLGSRLDTILGAKYLGQVENIVTKIDLLQPEFNILEGSIYLGILMDEAKSATMVPHDVGSNATLGNVVGSAPYQAPTEVDNVRMDKVAVRYNAGYFAFNSGKSLDESIDALLNDAYIPTESKNYVTKLVGTNGVLSAIA